MNNNGILKFVEKNKVAVIVAITLMSIGMLATTTNYFFGALVLVPRETTTISANQISTEQGFNLDTKDGDVDVNVPIYFKPTESLYYFATKVSIDTSLFEFKDTKCTFVHNSSVPKTGGAGNYTISNNANEKSSSCTSEVGSDYIYIEINPQPGLEVIKKDEVKVLAVIHLKLKKDIKPGSFANAVTVGDPDDWMGQKATSSSTAVHIDVQAIAPTTSIAPTPGTYNSTQNITLTCSSGDSPCSKTYYTLDGSNPTTGSLVYSSPISIDKTTTIKYFSVGTNGQKENIKVGAYTIEQGLTGNLSCGTVHDTYVTTLPSAGLCENGTSRNIVSMPNYWTWECVQNTQTVNCKALYGVKKSITVLTVGNNEPINNAILSKNDNTYTSTNNIIEVGFVKSGQDLVVLTSSGLSDMVEPMIFSANVDNSDHLVLTKSDNNLLGAINGSNISLKLRGDVSSDGKNNTPDGIVNIYDSIYIYTNSVFNQQAIGYTISSNTSNNDGKTFTFGVNSIDGSNITGVKVFYKLDNETTINSNTLTDVKYIFNLPQNKSGLMVAIKDGYEPFVARFSVTNTGKVDFVKLNNTFGKVTALGQYIQLSIRNDVSANGENFVSDGKVDINDAVRIFKNSIGF